MYRDTYSVEFDFGPASDNPLATFVLDIDYEYQPGRPARLHPWPGEPPEAPEVYIVKATMHRLIGTQRLDMAPAAADWLMGLLDMRAYLPAIAEHAEEGIQAVREERADMQREERV